MNDRNFAESAHHKEVCERLERESFAYRLVLDFLRRTFRIAYIVDNGIGVTVHSPERIGHIDEVHVGTVGSEGEVRAAAPVHISGHNLSDLDESSLEVIPR